MYILCEVRNRFSIEIVGDLVCDAHGYWEIKLKFHWNQIRNERKILYGWACPMTNP